LPPEVIQFVDKDEASRKLNWPVDTGGWWFPEAGWVQPPSLCRAALAAYPERITTIFNAAVNRIKRTKTGWQALDAGGAVIAEAPHLIMASGVAATALNSFPGCRKPLPAARSAICRAALTPRSISS
jgi:tRNA 5-methylaminomethyl-2-thiouridine biosynthesis bifunctional protein